MPTPMSERPHQAEYSGIPCFWCGSRRMERMGDSIYRCRNEKCRGPMTDGCGELQTMRIGVFCGVYTVPTRLTRDAA